MSMKISEWRRIVDRQHDQINDRANVFLILNVLLMAAVSTTIVKHLPSVLSVLGIVLNGFWNFLGRYSKNRYIFFYEHLKNAESELPENDRIYTEVQKSAPKIKTFKNINFFSTDFLSIYLPSIFTFLWVVVLLLIIIF